MEINFSSDKPKKNVAGLKTGTFEDMVKMRKKMLPEIQKEIQDMFNDYDGGLVAIMVVKEDENGHADHHHFFLGGVAHISGQIRMGKALSEASNKVGEMLLENAKGDPKALKQILAGLAEELLHDLEDNK